MLVLGIESSCDETACAVIEDATIVRSNVIGTQIDLHRPYGGVVPEIAARAHLELISPILKQALTDANVTAKDIDAVAVTQGPGLIGALLVGVGAAKAFAIANDIPLIGVHHIEGHLFATQLEYGLLEPPVLGVVVSGGHTSLLLLERDGSLTSIGHTIDDAAGEAFDKVARFLSMPYPGGPPIDKLGALGNSEAIAFPRPLLNDGTFNFSMSGLKTAVIRELRRKEHAGEPIVLNDVCASFNQAVADVLVTKAMAAADAHNVTNIALVGGVASNQRLRSELAQACERTNRKLLTPPPILCTDNGAMIGAAGSNRILAGQTSPLSIDADSRMQLSSIPLSALKLGN